jgi:citrate synthase
MSKDTLTITDQRTDKTYETPVELGTIRAMDLRKIKTGPEDFGLMTYDPAFTNTVSCKSSITYIDGDKGILRYRGYDIETLAEHCTYLQVAYLLLFGELPNPQQDKDWTWEITHHTMLHESTKHFIDGFRYDAHPMGILVSTLAASPPSIPKPRTSTTQ